MLAIERRREILSRLALEGKVIVSELAKDFDVTEETIRRDLDKLDKEGLASKTYGGAVSRQNPLLDLPYKIRIGVNVEQKQKISDTIASLVEDGERIMLDASSTAIYIVKKLKNKKNLTVITNSVEVLLELADKPDWTVLSTGGVLKEGALSLTGSSAEKMIASYHVDTAICSCKGIDTEFGVTESSEKDSLIKQAMFASAERCILAADSEKFDRKSFVRVCRMSDVDILVTDERPADKWADFCRNNNIRIVY
ncbi:MAG: DeoR/GlpR family DNA-binding transcription regulator [Clostridia bacterium]|nr:DeoR/GlpR family DNA-binding transcription regulator [Clostridia bacterium]